MEEPPLPRRVERERPRLHRRHLRRVGDVLQQPPHVHRNVRAVFDKHGGRGICPVSFGPARQRAKPRLLVGPARRRPRGDERGWRTWRDIQHAAARRAEDDGVTPDLTAAISCGPSLNADGVARLQRRAIPPALLQIDRALKLDRPVRGLGRPWRHVDEHVHVRVAPVDQRDDAFERHAFVVVELRENLVMRDQARRCTGGQDKCGERRRGGEAWLISSRAALLLPRHLERTAFFLILPGARHCPVGKLQVFDLPVDDVGQRAT